jgi:hypothetical protein
MSLKLTGALSFFLVGGAKTEFCSTIFEPKLVFLSASRFSEASRILLDSTALF